ncbi:BrnT family toxin [Symplocastrum sp. BBK-W-15]|uniref:BrnT family toxin n=1 Tax=Limnofasciculus baicalensis BBK-W-15 TaxID=2699891 RepID=A0AAE3GT41_9CYAN|nr:BrnT family toxin [Limnofasciculus baicalensis BBK-W-15]
MQGVVIVTVAHTERNEVIRIISARKATRQEKNTYYDYLAETT